MWTLFFQLSEAKIQRIIQLSCKKIKKMTKKIIQLQFNCFILIFDLNNPYSRNFFVQRLFGWCWCQRHWSTIPWQDEAVPEEISRLIPPYFSKYVTISKNRVFFLLICSFQLPHPRTPAHQNAHAATLVVSHPQSYSRSPYRTRTMAPAPQSCTRSIP